MASVIREQTCRGETLHCNQVGRGKLYFVYQTLEKWLPPYELCIYPCPVSATVLLGSGCVYVFILKTYQQKSSFLCYRLPKIVTSFQFRSFFKCIVF